MIVLNSVVAYQLTKFKEEVDQIIKKGRKKDEAIFQVLKKYILESENVSLKGITIPKSGMPKQQAEIMQCCGVPDSIKCFLTEESRNVLVGSGIFTNKELESRVEVEYEKFTKKVQIESRVLGDLAINHIVPTAIKYMTTLIENVKGLKEVFPDKEFEHLAGSRKELIVTLSDHINEIRKLVHDMIEERKKANVIEDKYKKAITYEKKVKPYFTEIREHIDKLELIVDDEMWPLPKYRELLFTC